MKIFGTAALLAGAVLLSACGGSSHSVCKDEKSATEYAMKIMGEIQAAAAAGKIDMQKMQEGAAKMQKDGADVGNDYAKGCKLLDDYKASLGL